MTRSDKYSFIHRSLNLPTFDAENVLSIINTEWFLFVGTELSAFHELIHLILSTNLMREILLLFPFTDERTETQRSFKKHPRTHS